LQVRKYATRISRIEVGIYIYKYMNNQDLALIVIGLSSFNCVIHLRGLEFIIVQFFCIITLFFRTYKLIFTAFAMWWRI